MHRIKIKAVGLSSFRSASVSKRLHQRVLSEARAIAALNHPNIVRYYSTWLEVKWSPSSDAPAPGSEASVVMAESGAETQVEDVDLYQQIPTMLRKDTDLYTQEQKSAEEEEVVVVEEEDEEEEISFKEQSASQRAEGQGQEASEEEGTGGWGGGVTGALVPVRRGARLGQGGLMVTGGDRGGMVAVKANPNGWYPETWGSTLEAEMEVVIQMEHCGLVSCFTLVFNFLTPFFFYTLRNGGGDPDGTLRVS
jgi:hypothetical protein